MTTTYLQLHEALLRLLDVPQHLVRHLLVDKDLGHAALLVEVARTHRAGKHEDARELDVLEDVDHQATLATVALGHDEDQRR
jgi:hypothetical protein